LFVCAVRGKRRIVWPNPTHCKDPDADAGDMFRPKLRKWVAAREIIDWAIPAKKHF
jgi:DNA (cytosine-5)-methyltransferase 1